MKIKNMLNAHLFPYDGKVFTMPSETIPDQTMSIREILEKHSRGIPYDAKTSIWHDEDEDNFMPDIRTLDLSERQDYIENAKKELAEVKEKIAEKRKKKAIIEPEIINPPAQLEN